jgi:hypothetical protein
MGQEFCLVLSCLGLAAWFFLVTQQGMRQLAPTPMYAQRTAGHKKRRQCNGDAVKPCKVALE